MQQRADQNWKEKTTFSQQIIELREDPDLQVREELLSREQQCAEKMEVKIQELQQTRNSTE